MFTATDSASNVRLWCAWTGPSHDAQPHFAVRSGTMDVRLFMRAPQRRGALVTTMSSTSPAEWFTAIGTIGATVVALAIASAPPWWRWLKRPKLEVVFSRDLPHIRRMTDGIWLRLAVGNGGKREAIHVRGLITDWWYKDRSGRWIKHDLDPSFLHWTGTPHMDESMVPSEVSLPSKTTWFLDLCWHSAQHFTQIVLDNRAIDGFDLDARTMLGEFRAKVVITSDNAGAVERTIGWTVEAGEKIGQVGLAHAPDVGSPH